MIVLLIDFQFDPEEGRLSPIFGQRPVAGAQESSSPRLDLVGLDEGFESGQVPLLEPGDIFAFFMGILDAGGNAPLC